MKIDIISDVICPWCYIGKKNLEAAMAQRPAIQFELQWQPYQLHPEAPTEGYNYRESIERKYGKQRIDAMFAQITQAGKLAGIAFDLDGIERGANTLNAHRLLDYAYRQHGSSQQNALSEALFKAYFCQQRDIGNTQVLALIADEVGINGEQASIYLDSEDDLAALKKHIADNREQDISGVPSFNFNGRLAVGGGQQSDVFLTAIDRFVRKNSGAKEAL